MCGGGVATQKQPQEGACAQGGASGGWRVQGMGRKHVEELRCSKNKAGTKGPEKTLGPAEPREAPVPPQALQSGQRF